MMADKKNKCKNSTTSPKAEGAMLSAKEAWEQTFDAVNDLLAIINTEYQLVRVNKAMAAKLGRTPEECIGLTCYSALHGTTSPPAFCPHQQLTEDGQGHTAEVYDQQLGGHFSSAIVRCAIRRVNSLGAFMSFTTSPRTKRWR